MGHPLFDLSGRVALVSGTASGMGRAIATGFAEAGADLVLADIDSYGNEATAEKLWGLGRRAVAVTCDISDPEQIADMFARLDREYGKIDILANVAGAAQHGAPMEITLEGLHQSLQSLVVGRFFCCQQAGERMLAAGKGCIINIGSLASVTAMGRGHIAYSMAMGAVAQMTRELSTEWSSRGVRVNAILCGQVPSKQHYERAEQEPWLMDYWMKGAAWVGLACPTISRAWRCFWLPTLLRGSPGCCCPWTVAIWR